MFKTLYAKLIFWFFAILSLITIIFISLATFTIPLYQQEISQKLQENLAFDLVKDNLLFDKNEWNKDALKSIFHNLMVINPSIEVYLTDINGKILSYSAPPGKVKQEFIDLTPVKQFLDRSRQMPIFGDNPRDSKLKKVFSVAPIYNNKEQAGYLYIVLGGDEYDSVVNMIKGSYILQFSSATALIALLVTLVVGIFIFNVITRRLRFLSKVMDKFKKSNFEKPLILPSRFDGRPVDEIDQIGTTFREMSERIIQQVNELKATDVSRRELVANVSHDLRTPLSSLQGYLETLTLKSADLDEKEKQQYLSIALKQSERLGRLISELFELAMLENNRTKVNHEPFSLAELAQDIAQKFKLDAQQKNIQLETNLPADAPFVSADIALIERVLENLIENAIKYTSKGGHINLTIRHDNNQLITLISDSGNGIPEEDIPHIFDRFYRVDKSRDSAQPGTGLGLAITKRILQLHNSAIKVSSQIDIGSEFSFSLPEFSTTN